MKFTIGYVWLVIVLIFTGCTSQKAPILSVQTTPVMTARYTGTPINVDGRLDEPVWKQARVYTMNLAEDLTAQGQTLEQQGQVRLAWDKHYLYIGFTFYDFDLVAQGTGDEQPHYQLGDVAEVFLKPRENTWYWELYVTPGGKKTRYWFPGSGRLGLAAGLSHPNTISVGAQNQGTLNDWKDRDESWTAEMAIPVSELTVLGDSFGPERDWRILIGRYNYSRYRSQAGPEISMTPQIQTTSFHRTGEYARLVLEK